MVDQSKNIMIGLFVIAAFAITIFIILFIHPTVGDEGHLLRVRFSNIDKVNIGTRVTFGGKPVGEVIEIKEIINDIDPRKTHDGTVYVYELTLAVDSSVEVYNSDSISLRTSGLLGERSVNITPLPAKLGEKLKIVNKEIIYADEAGSVEDTIKYVQSLSDKINEALNVFIKTFQDVENERLVANVSDTFKNLNEITSPEKWHSIIANVESVTNSIAEGKGTVGKLITNDDLYLRTVSLMNKAETTMNDVNHYGLLFHLDKSWQRLRARRLNLLQKLRTPQEFRNYFNDEIDQISTSLSRVSMVLESQGCTRMAPRLIQDYEFNKVFAELLRRVGQIEEELKIYNDQLVDEAVSETELCTPCCN